MADILPWQLRRRGEQPEQYLWIFATRNTTDRAMTEFPTDKVFVRICHVKRGYEDRERHITAGFAPHGIPVNWFLDWDISDISAEEKARRVASEKLLPAEISCAMKHIGVWQAFLASGYPYCLVFEDDVILSSHFCRKFNEGLVEFADPDRNAVVYLGNGGNYYTALWQLKKGRHLYPAPHCRNTDSYLITRRVAEARCAWFAANKITLPIDHQIDRIDAQNGVEVLWFERPIVEQGTQNGTFSTSIIGRKSRARFFQRLEWNWKKYRRQLFGYTSRPQR